MHITVDPAQHLTYCLNVHPGERWEDNFAAIRTKALHIRDRVCPGAPFGLGLRLGNEASLSLLQPENLQAFLQFLSDHNLYVFTVNGFPYGAFHQTRVKERVYQPDWRTPERVAYTCRLADILAVLVPEGIRGSISTLPCSYKAWISTEDEKRAMAQNLTAVALHLDDIFTRTGKRIHLGLEPEPDCLLETTEEAIRFFEKYLFIDVQEALIRRHIGLCFDTCHMAIQFEDLAESLKKLVARDILISKIQLSAAPALHCDAETPAVLKGFCDPVYLHQVKVRDASGRILSCPDLPEALELHQASGSLQGEWRVHFHVPLYFTVMGDLRSTAGQLSPAFFKTARECGVEHLEIETYTFDVLPEDMRALGVEASIAAEYAWVLKQVGDAS